VAGRKGGDIVNLTGGEPNDERYTPPRIIRRVRRVLGAIDCDPATCAEAQETVKADTYYTREDDGLNRPWVGRVWVNPPYSKGLLHPFILALFRELHAGRCTEAICLTNNATETAAIQALLRGCQCVCLITARIAFTGPGLDGSTGGYQGQILTYFGPRAGRFMRVMSEIGVCFVPGQIRQAGLFDGGEE
jgi:ParB family chromosome partitioning protein